MTAAALLREAAQALRAAGVAAADRDAERLLRHVVGWDRAALVARPDSAIPAGAESQFRALVARRARREPLQHLVGTQAFWRHDFLVTEDVLIPRPETELLVEAALELLRPLTRPVIVDVGTGSGCIALSLAAERPDAQIHATDVSRPALRVARENARRLELEGRVAFHAGDLLEPLASLSGAIDLVVSNPPYVDEAERDALAPEVRDHEPRQALDGGTDGLCFYRLIIPGSLSHLNSRGWLLLEIGIGQAAEVIALFESTRGFTEIFSARDPGGIERVVGGRKI